MVSPIPMFLSWIALVSLFFCDKVSAAAASEPFQAGQIASSVIALDGTNFDLAVRQDPANPIWLLKFYAPWCGHCKRLAPVLEKAAPKLKGRIAIGTIDCTIHKPLCNEHSVRSFPTLKFALDGKLYEYSGGRKEEDFAKLADKLQQPIVAAVDTWADAVAASATAGVGFVAYHPDVQGFDTAAAAAAADVDATELAKSTPLTEMFAQAARPLRVEGTFLLLKPSAADIPSPPTANAGFVCRVEAADVPPRCANPADLVDATTLRNFMQAHNVPTVTSLGPHNFYKLGRRGRPLVIGIVAASDGEKNSASQQEQLTAAAARQTLMAVATTAPWNEKYYFGTLEGLQWERFLEQFEIQAVPTKDGGSTIASPAIFILNVPTKEYWHNATLYPNIADVQHLLQAVADGSLESRFAASRHGRVAQLLHEFGAFLDLYRPWSVMALMLVLVGLMVAAAACVVPGEDLRPPSARAEPEPAAAESTESVENKESKKDQ